MEKKEKKLTEKIAWFVAVTLVSFMIGFTFGTVSTEEKKLDVIFGLQSYMYVLASVVAILVAIFFCLSIAYIPFSENLEKDRDW